MRGKLKLWSVMASACALLLTGVTFAGPTSAQDFPSKPITVIIPFGPGGSHDMNARVFTSVIPQYLGQPVVVKLMPGASGQKGTAAAIKAPADGYTLLFTHNFLDQLQPLVEDLSYNPSKDLVTVAQLNSAPPIYWVGADKPWKSMKEVLAWATENPGKLRFSHSGKWGSSFTGGAMVFVNSGVDAVYLPYKGGGPSKQAVLAGDADMTIGRVSTVLDEAKAGKVRVLAVGGSKRLAEFPDVPTTQELGLGAEDVMHRIIQVPAGTPQERIDILRQAFAKLQEDKTYQKLLGQLGEDSDYLDAPEYDQIRKAQGENYLKLVKSITGN